MKNVKDYQLKKCIFMETEEFDRIIKTVFGNNYEAEFSLDGIDVSSDEDGLTCEEINEGLSKYFDVSCDYLLGVSDAYLPIGGEVLDKDIINFFNLYQQLNEKSSKELLSYADYLLYLPENEEENK